MTEQPLVSLVMPMYNVSEFLEESFTCATQQTYKNIEIVVVDDGSTDDSLAIAQDWARKDSRIRVVHQENGGLSSSRNTGLREARGEYLYFFDPDDVFEKNLIEWAMTAMRNFRADVVMFKFDTIGVSGAPLKSAYSHNDYSEVQVLTPEEALKQQLHSDISGYMWSFVARTDIYRKQHLTFPVGRKIEDLARICNILGESQRVVRLTETLYHYRLRPGSLMGQISPSLISDWSKAIEDREDYILTRYPQLKGYMMLQSLSFFSNLDYESLRQSLIFGLKLDPESVERRANERHEQRAVKKSQKVSRISKSRKAKKHHKREQKFNNLNPIDPRHHTKKIPKTRRTKG